ncbi:hypothetical protein CL648_00545 [bacterium]|jgi:phosphate:Na+ symporter|nr:hypothetical protein [bacterium]|tara:strand:- start:1147 stop:2799 length:1653 start_codon:yes stop_codon:yes gene_type:complete
MLVLNILGGLGVFLYGLKIMSDTLQKISSSKLRSFFNKFTKNKLIGIGLGAVVTSILQSSSATTVILVGFANAGVIKLTQCISIIFGANIGTTITAQIIAFKSSTLALPLIGVSALFLLLAKKPRTRQIGELLLGLGLLFLGLKLMGAYLKPLKDIPLFSELFISFGTNPLLGILVGALVTMVVQSSSATTGMIIALASMDAINFPSAFALELGGNIGTTITAQIASINTNITARRTAWAHTLFNVIGATYMLILFYIKVHGQPVFLHLINACTPGNVFAGENLARHIANAHTVFNVFNAVIMFPFINKLARLTEYIVPGKIATRDHPQSYIDDRLSSSPPISLMQARKELTKMNYHVHQLTTTAYNKLLGKSKPSLSNQEADDTEQTVNSLHNKLTQFLVALNVDILTESQHIKSNKLIHTTGHLERVGDYATSIINQIDNQSIQLPESLTRIIEPLFDKINHQHELIDHFLLAQPSTQNSEILNQRAIELEQMLRREHLSAMRTKQLTTQQGLAIVGLIHNLERISSHLKQAAQSIPFTQCSSSIESD